VTRLANHLSAFLCIALSLGTAFGCAWLCDRCPMNSALGTLSGAVAFVSFLLFGVFTAAYLNWLGGP
jgi:hypothetical protein